MAGSSGTVVAATPRAPARRRRRRRGTLRGRQQLLAWAFLSPLLVVNLLVIAGPSVATVYYSLTDWSGVGSANFVGLQNYRDLLGDAEFRKAFVHNLQYTAFFLTVPIAMGLLGAYLLSRIRRFQLLFRVVFFLPYMVASVVNAAIWKILLDPEQGIGSVIPALENVFFLGDPQLALLSIAFVDNWRWWGFIVVLFMTAMQGVDSVLYEAAEVDGATRWQQFRHITLPGIQATLVFVVLITVIGSLLVFDYIYILTNGGPAGASEVVATLMYKEAFDRFEAGYAASMGLALTLITGIVIAGFVALRRRGWEI